MTEINSFPNNVDEYVGAETVMKWLHGRTSGVYGADDNLAVTISSAMTVQVSDGLAWITSLGGDGTVVWNNYYAKNSSNLPLTLGMADSVSPRIDRVVIDLMTTNYATKPEIKVITGTPASTPTSPALTRTATEYMISLAKVYVAAGATTITAENITDERLDSSVCGLVTESVGVDTSVMQAQFTAWFERVKGQLSTDVAGNLQNEIDALTTTTTALSKGQNEASYTIASSGWSTSTTTINGTAYYTYVITVTSINKTHPDIFEGAAGTVPTSDEDSAYANVKHAYNDGATKITLCAESKPTTNFVIVIRGITA